MAEKIKPSTINLVWAQTGSVVKPLDSKILAGWVSEIPPYQWFNWILNRTDAFNAHINQHGLVVWDAATEYQAGKSYIQGSNGTVYKCKATNTNQDPIGDTSETYWEPAFQAVRGQMQRDKATAAAPSYSFAGDTNTGINSAAADTVAIVTGGVNRVTVVNFGMSVTGNLNISGAVEAGLKAAIADVMYPVGSIYSNISDSTNPATLFGIGTWVAIEGRVVVGLDPAQTEFDTAGETGGEKTHTLTQAELPAYNIAFQKSDVSTASPNYGAKAWPGTGNSPVTENVAAGGSGQAHNNLQPYVVAYVWKRTA